MQTFSIAGLQLCLAPATSAEASNFEEIREHVLSTVRRFPHVDMIILRELCTFGPAPRFAEIAAGATDKKYAALAVEADVWLCNGSVFEREGANLYNTMSLYQPDGKVACRYRKMYPFLPHEVGISAGNEPKVFEIPGVGRLGLSICYDMWFPETIRSLVWQGAEIIIHPTLTNTIDRDAELSIARANATMNQCYLVDINAAGFRFIAFWFILLRHGGMAVH